MLFCSYQFLVFFTAVFAVYWALPWPRVRVWLLLAASFIFYASWNRWLACLIVASTTADFFLARALEASRSPRMRRVLLGINIAGNLGVLCYFKYANFFLDSLGELLTRLGLESSLPVLSVILPIGISFYTFEALNYMIDVYRGQLQAERSLPHFMLFILFFPHLIAGPIVRARDFLPQIRRRKQWNWARAQAGVLLILLGVVKKLAVADRMALYADPVFADPGTHATLALWLATVAYAIQVYCDFSGYSDMALGLSHLLGYHLVQNFDTPFLSRNITEFWRRWHISLSTWIRDYLFIPLGGSRGSRLATCRNVLITFMLCGLWHGAGWNFVAWGFLTGVLLVVHSAFRSWCARQPHLSTALESAPGTALRIGLTFTCFCLTLVVFRNQALTGAATMLGRMFVPADGAGLHLTTRGLYLTFAAVALAHVLGHGERGTRLWERLPAPVRGLCFGAALTVALALAPDDTKAFIYFQF